MLYCPDHRLTTCIVSGCCRVFLQLPSHLPSLYGISVNILSLYNGSLVTSAIPMALVSTCYLFVSLICRPSMVLVSTFHLSAGKQAEIVKDVVSVAMCHLLAVTRYYDCWALSSLSVAEHFADFTLITLYKLNIEYFECC